MRYAILIHDRPDAYQGFTDEQRQELTDEYMALRGRPGFLDGARLQPADTATTLRLEDGEALITDGPFAATKEVFAGFYVFELDDLDSALEIARAVPAARFGGAVEVRPMVDMPVR